MDKTYLQIKDNINMKFLKGKKVLIAGGSGLLGVNITRYMLEYGIDVQSTFFSRKPPEHLKNYYKRYDFTKYKECLKATKGQDYVIICAAQASGVVGMASNPTNTILPNLEINAGLFEACAQNNVAKTLWISSSTVYQESFYPIREDQLDLNKPPYALYLGIGWVYRYLEELIKCYYYKYGMQIGIIRTSNIYGPYDKFDDKKSNVIPALIKRALNKEEPFVVWGSNNTIRDFIFVDDLIIGILGVLEKYCNGDPINISSGEPVSIGELVNKILYLCKHNVMPYYDTSKPTAIPYRVLDTTKYETLLGRKHKTSLREGIEYTINWFTSELFSE